MTGLLCDFRDDFRQIVRHHGDRVAVIDARHDDVISYAALASLLERYGLLFQAHGLAPGQPVVAMIPNSLENLACFLATMQYGYGYAPITTDATPPEVARWMRLVRPGLSIVADTVADDKRAALADSGIPAVTVPIDSRFDWLPPASPGNAPAPSDANACLFLSTSGSTGEPRAMVIDCNRLWSSGKAFAETHRFLDENARFLNFLPMSYLGGLFNLGLIPLAVSGSAVVTEAFSGRSFLDFWQTVERFEVNVLWLAPTIIRGLLTLSDRIRRPEVAGGAPSVRACFLGTAPIDLQTKRRFEEAFGIPVLENFALSETTFFTTETLDTRFRRIENSVGEILPFAEVDLVAVDEPDETGDQPSEIRVRTPFLFRGYLQDDGSIDLPLDEDGYFRTGDFGRLEQGDLLVLTGRRRDIIKKGGYFVSLRAVEVLAEQHEDVDEAVAVGVPHDFYGESFVLYVRLAGDRPDKWAFQTFSPWLHGNLVKYMWPERVVVVDDFPRTASGKVQKHLLSEHAGGQADQRRA